MLYSVVDMTLVVLAFSLSLGPDLRVRLSVAIPAGTENCKVGPSTEERICIRCFYGSWLLA